MPIFNLGFNVSSNFAGCATAGQTATLVPANILFIIDRSGSMNCNLPPITASADCEAMAAKKDPNSPSKWEVVRDALKKATRPTRHDQRGHHLLQQRQHLRRAVEAQRGHLQRSTQASSTRSRGASTR